MNPIIHTFIDTVSKYNAFTHTLQHTKRLFGQVELYPSEIHTLVYIADHDTDNFTQIAEGLAITKGALTKIIDKIEQKKLIVKYYQEGNRKSIYYTLTQPGKEAYENHLQFHKKYTLETGDAFDRFLTEHEEVLHQFFKHTNSVIDDLTIMIREE